MKKRFVTLYAILAISAFLFYFLYSIAGEAEISGGTITAADWYIVVSISLIPIIMYLLILGVYLIVQDRNSKK